MLNNTYINIKLSSQTRFQIFIPAVWERLTGWTWAWMWATTSMRLSQSSHSHSLQPLYPSKSWKTQKTRGPRSLISSSLGVITSFGRNNELWSYLRAWVVLTSGAPTTSVGGWGTMFIENCVLINPSTTQKSICCLLGHSLWMNYLLKK